MARTECTACTAVVGFDDSDAARAALKVAVDLAQPDGRIILTRGNPRYGVLDTFVGDGAEAQSLNEAIETTAAETAAESGLPVEVVIITENPVEALTATAEKYKADMIVVGAKGQGALAGAILGSTTYKLLHRATCPVLVVPAP